jgi:hypothetical protein
MTAEEFSAACGHKINFGRNIGLTVARTGASDEGLLYLDWAVDGATNAPKDDLAAIKAYLSHPTISSRVNELLDN